MSGRKTRNNSLASITRGFTFYDAEDTDDDADSVFSYDESIRTISSTIYENEKKRRNSFELVCLEDGPFPPGKYNKHSYLDLSELSLKQQIRLRWMHALKWHNIIRCGMVIFCLAWFAFNGVTIFKDFLKHDTLIFLEYNRPQKTLPPGITICTHCILCNIHNSTIERVLTRHLFRDFLLLRYINQYEEYKTEYRDIKIECQMVLNGYDYEQSKRIPCESVAKVMLSMQEGHKCYTFFSNLFGQMNNPNDTLPELDYDLLGSIEIKITGNFLPKADENVTVSKQHSFTAKTNNYNRSTGLFVTVHDPEILPDMNEASFHKLLLGRTHHLPFVKMSQNLLPEPFSSKCYDYSKEKMEKDLLEEFIYTKNELLTPEGLKVYRSKGECVLFCLWRMLNAERCTNFFSIFTEEMVAREETFQTYKILRRLMARNLAKHMESNQSLVSLMRFNNKMCPINNRRFEAYIATKLSCDKVCPPACSIDSFATDSYFDEPSYIKNFNQTNIQIYWSQQLHTKIYHRQKMDFTDFLGNLGGQAHIWVGVSLLHIIRYLIHFISSSEFRAPNRDCCSILHWVMDCFAIRKRLY